MWLSPSARQPRSRARWQMDLSPGTVTRPESPVLFAIVTADSDGARELVGWDVILNAPSWGSARP